ncbi:GRP family sugar transporter [Lactobacillus hominis]|uniref:Sugar transporter n=1 Tax=Lactobacillus hominis DSM 23910 = CRBIP 24.179 TaxID=1423758 RepID=I7KI48_9LACO|nr:GRP family sugar transporter [Lactobacillus hominis]MCT3348588.1 sugar transporter [Lactobacillus hominis]CCI82685.1 Putative uncharacterized protein [Lactobacillus hominis DSM 23910 = CRBIP 24.179]
MNILIALIPALGWGIFPLIAGKIKNSKPSNEIFGLAIGALIIGIITAIINPSSVSPKIFLLSLLSGMFWTMGQAGQFISMSKVGISKTMPLSTGLQLIGNTLIGVIMFNEWSGLRQYVVGIISLILIIIGVSLTAISRGDESKITGKDFLLLLFTSIGYWIYSTFPKTITADAQSLFFPQMFGIFIGSIIYLLITRQTVAFKQKATYLNIFSGFSFGIAALAYIFSAKMNGVINAFVYSQLCVIISTLGGIFIVGERKPKFEFIATLIGLVLIIIGAAIH